MRLFPQSLQVELQNKVCSHLKIPSHRYTDRPDLLDMVKKSKDALKELLNHPKVSLGTIDGTGRNLEMVARWVFCNQIDI